MSIRYTTTEFSEATGSVGSLFLAERAPGLGAVFLPVDVAGVFESDSL